MNRYQRAAWSAIATECVVLGIVIIVFALGLPIDPAVSGFVFSVMLGLAGLPALLFRKDSNKVKFDERDLLINRNAMLFSLIFLWEFFVAAAILPFFLLDTDGKVGLWYLSWMLFGGEFIFLFVYSLVILKEYGWTRKGEKL